VKRKSRPCSVTLLSLGVLSIAVFNLVRMIQSLRNWQFLTELLNGSLLYISLSGLFWALVGFPLAWGIWRGWKGIFFWTLAATLAYSIYYWVDRLIIAGVNPTNWKFALVLNLILFFTILMIFRQSKGKAFFGEKNEH
jgi:hypothetical protein